MRCTHAEKLIPLFAGDDLPAREAGALRRHLESCANCRRLAAEFEESRDWLRGFPAPNFDEAMLDDLRDSVLRGIGRVENRSRLKQWIVPGLNLRFAFATSLALLLLIIWLGLMSARRQPQRDPVHNRADAQKDGGHRIELPSDKNSNDQANTDQRIVKDKQDRRGFTRKPVKPRLHESPQTERQTIEPDSTNAELAASRDTLRIEIQTADPNIRIIWFAQNTGVSPISRP
ncbi:MAG TPA: zf-HC2 domain-containing protein [Blastocatellia bacterium]|nr:zf-HC2 domain-containing protein [Blastocatellia bacterium]